MWLPAVGVMAECVETAKAGGDVDAAEAVRLPHSEVDAVGHDEPGNALTRRRADTSHLYLEIAVENLTGEQKRDVQACYVERYQGRLDRAQWDREFRREAGVVKLRIYGTARTRRVACG
jgi:hypothetical protein